MVPLSTAATPPGGGTYGIGLPVSPLTIALRVSAAIATPISTAVPSSPAFSHLASVAGPLPGVSALSFTESD